MLRRDMPGPRLMGVYKKPERAAKSVTSYPKSRAPKPGCTDRDMRQRGRSATLEAKAGQEELSFRNTLGKSRPEAWGVVVLVA